MQRMRLLLLLLTLSRPPCNEGTKAKRRMATKPTSKAEGANEKEFVLPIEREVERGNFRRLPEDMVLPNNPQLWKERTARESAALKRRLWTAEHSPNEPVKRRIAASRTSRNPRHPLRNLTYENLVDKQLIDALNDEALNPTLFDDYDDEFKLVRDLKDRVGEKVLTAWRKRARFRPAADMLVFKHEPLVPLHKQIGLPLMRNDVVRSQMRRSAQELFLSSKPDTTQRMPPAPPRKPPAAPGPSRRTFEMEIWLSKYQWNVTDRPAKTYKLNTYLYESWISKLWYYSTPHPTRLKNWAFRKMQESIYHVQDWVAILDDFLSRNANNIRFQTFYTAMVFNELVQDIFKVWRYLRHRFYFVAQPGYIDNKGSNMTQIKDKWRYFASPTTITKYLFEYTRVVQRYVDLIYMSAQITHSYENRMLKKYQEELKSKQRKNKRKKNRFMENEDSPDQREGDGPPHGGSGR